MSLDIILGVWRLLFWRNLGDYHRTSTAFAISFFHLSICPSIHPSTHCHHVSLNTLMLANVSISRNWLMPWQSSKPCKRDKPRRKLQRSQATMSVAMFALMRANPAAVALLTNANAAKLGLHLCKQMDCLGKKASSCLLPNKLFVYFNKIKIYIYV